MIDIHSHILPGVDDGAKGAEVARRMAERYREAGVAEVVCTPHMDAEHRDPAPLKEAFAAFQEAMRSVPVRFYLGSEIYYYPDMADDLAAGKLLPFGGSRTVLVEFSTRQETEIADIVYDLGVAGYRPIVAHIERYWYLKKEDYFLIRESGGRIQINAGAFAHEHTTQRSTVPAQAKARRCDRLRCARRCAPPRRFRPCAKDRPPQVPAAVQGAV